MNFALINLSEVRGRIRRSRGTIYSEIGRGIFPRPLKIGKRSFWRDDEIDDLITAYAAGASPDELCRLCDTFYERRLAR
ncbi:MAG TPA: AlpA family phage regulatory protein [Allosphingosinicella sp.]|nr:AlpA family phage regulatory protein [Allosphingosinicella sp.]